MIDWLYSFKVESGSQHRIHPPRAPRLGYWPSLVAEVRVSQRLGLQPRERVLPDTTRV